MRERWTTFIFSSYALPPQVNGVPVVSPLTTDYTNIKLGDVSGWAPTPDTFAFNFNYCDGGNLFLPPANISKPLGGDGNTHAIKGLLDGEYDALYMYSDQLYNFVNSNDANADLSLIHI